MTKRGKIWQSGKENAVKLFLQKKGLKFKWEKIEKMRKRKTHEEKKRG